MEIYKDSLKHVLCNALVHMQAISTELKKLNIKEKSEDNDPAIMAHANRLYLTMTAINDIIHPGHDLLDGYFPGTEEYFELLRTQWANSKKDKLSFEGCLCSKCGVKKDVA